MLQLLIWHRTAVNMLHKLQFASIAELYVTVWFGNGSYWKTQEWVLLWTSLHWTYSLSTDSRELNQWTRRGRVVERAHLRYVEGQTEVVSSTIPAHRLIHMCRCILEHSSADIPQMQYTSFDILYTAFTNMLCVVLHIYLCLFTMIVAIQLHVSLFICVYFHLFFLSHSRLLLHNLTLPNIQISTFISLQHCLTFVVHTVYIAQVWSQYVCNNFFEYYVNQVRCLRICHLMS